MKQLACALLAFSAFVAARQNDHPQRLIDFIPKGPGRPFGQLAALTGDNPTTEEQPAPAPEPAPAPAPAPAFVPAPEPAFISAPAPEPEPAFVPAPAPAPEPVLAPEPASEPAPVPVQQPIAATPTPTQDDESEEEQVIAEQQEIETVEEQPSAPPSPPASEIPSALPSVSALASPLTSASPMPSASPSVENDVIDETLVTSPSPSFSAVTVEEIEEEDDDDDNEGLSPIDADGEGFFPCHPTKGDTNVDVMCERVEVPSRLCKRCSLRPVTLNGEFEKCNQIFDTETDTCREAMQEYVQANECDHVRKQAVDGWLQGDSDSRKVVDYFLYSVCELCCDCVPMGAKKSDYKQLKQLHSPEQPSLWDPDRGNCPAHAEYDLCRVLPNVRYFTSVGGEEQDVPSACPALNRWLNSGRSTNWQTNPNADIDSSTATFLNGALDALDCHRSSIWKTCFDMEDLQGHIEIPGNPDDFDTSTFEEGSQPEPEMVDGQENDATGVAKNSSSSCFPGSATVELENGAVVRMDQLEIGDRVRTSRGFSDVFMFSHRDALASDDVYFRIDVGITAVTMTPGHYLPVVKTGRAKAFLTAQEIAAGDHVQLADGRWEQVVTVEEVAERGLYNPHTIDGDICVNGVVASTYTSAIASRTGHALLSPLRALYKMGIVGERELGSFLTKGWEGVFALGTSTA